MQSPVPWEICLSHLAAMEFLDLVMWNFINWPPSIGHGMDIWIKSLWVNIAATWCWGFVDWFFPFSFSHVCIAPGCQQHVGSSSEPHRAHKFQEILMFACLQKTRFLFYSMLVPMTRTKSTIKHYDGVFLQTDIGIFQDYHTQFESLWNGFSSNSQRQENTTLPNKKYFYIAKL